MTETAPGAALPEDWEQQDSINSYYEAMAELAVQISGGRPIPAMFMPRNRDAEVR